MRVENIWRYVHVKFENKLQNCITCEGKNKVFKKKYNEPEFYCGKNTEFFFSKLRRLDFNQFTTKIWLNRLNQKTRDEFIYDI